MRLTRLHHLLILPLGLCLVLASACGEGGEVESDDNTGTSEDASSDDPSGLSDATEVSTEADDEADAGPEQAEEGPAALEGQCSPEENEIVMTLNLEEVMTQCTNDCVMGGSTDISACVAECFTTSTELGPECSVCFGEMAECVLTECSDFCPFDVEGCSTCAEAQCSEPMQTCTGVNTPPPPELTCINPPDQQKIEAGALDAMEPCLPGCVEAEDPSDCFGTCASDQELSIDCSGCFADLGTCMTQLCTSECTADTFGDPACMSCAAENCGAAFQGCAGFDIFAEDSEPDPPGEAALCESPDDLEALQQGQELFADCKESCSADDAEAGCMSACIESSGVSGGCAGCLAPLQACLDEACLGCLVNDDDPACGQCLVQSCADALGSCFDGACEICPPLPSECSSEADADVLSSMQEEIGACTATCVDDADPLSCSSECLALTGLSDGCSGCMAELSVCTVSSCGASCNPGARAQDGGIACQQCLAGECAEETFACFGDGEGPGLPPVEGGAACVNEADDALLTNESDPKGVCEAACKDADDAATCLISCLEQAGFSAGCSSCISDLSECVKTQCAEACNNPANQEGCEACVVESCSAEEAACFQQGGPGAGGMCGGSADQSILEANPDMVSTCMAGCMSDPASAETCLSTCFSDLGLSGECSSCVSWMLGCTMSECANECSGSDMDACTSCSEMKCGEEMGQGLPLIRLRLLYGGGRGVQHRVLPDGVHGRGPRVPDLHGRRLP